MSQAFIRERDEEWLGDVAPNINALTKYLTKENSGIPVYEVKSYHSKEHGRQVYEMSNGMTYALDLDRRWYVLP